MAQLIFSMDNSFKFARHLGAGYCFGMSCDWALQSLRSQGGKGVTYKGQLQEFKWVIGQTAYETNKGVTDQGLITSMGLRSLGLHSGNIPTMHAVCVYACNTLKMGTYIFCIDGEGGGHAMGFRRVATKDVMGRSGASIQFFDPNRGLYNCQDNADFTFFIPQLLDEFYGTGEADPDERLDSHYEFFEVAA